MRRVVISFAQLACAAWIVSAHLSTPTLSAQSSGSFIRAMNPFTGKKVWDYPVAPGRTGPLSTAGGLVFLDASGGLVALDATTGKPVWHINVAQTSLSSPMTYMVAGRQYIALPRL